MAKFMTAQEFGNWHEDTSYQSNKLAFDKIYDILDKSKAVSSDDVRVQYQALPDRDKVTITNIIRYSHKLHESFNNSKSPTTPMTSRELEKWYNEVPQKGYHYDIIKRGLDKIYKILNKSKYSEEEILDQYQHLSNKDKMEITQIVYDLDQSDRLNSKVESQSRVESTGNINAGNLLIGQLVDVQVTDVTGAKFTKPMRVGELYPDSMVLLKDEITGDTVYLQFDQAESDNLSNGLVYKSLDSNTGLTYLLIISSNLMSNESITNRILESKINRLSSIIKLNN